MSQFTNHSDDEMLEVALRADLQAPPTSSFNAAEAARRAVRSGRRIRATRRAGMTVLPAGLAVAVALTGALPAGVTSHSRGGTAAGQPSATSSGTHSAGAHRQGALSSSGQGGGSGGDRVVAMNASSMFLAASSARLAAVATDGPVFVTHEHSVAPVKAGGAVTDEATYATADGAIRTVVTEAGKSTTRTYPVGFQHYAVSIFSPPGTAIGTPPQAFTRDEIRALPTDPGQLAAIIDAGVPAADIAMNRLNAVKSLFLAPTTTAVQAAGYQLLAHTPGIASAGEGRDVLGRPGQAYDMVSSIPSSPNGGTRITVVTRLIVGNDGLVLGLTFNPGTPGEYGEAITGTGYAPSM